MSNCWNILQLNKLLENDCKKTGIIEISAISTHARREVLQGFINMCDNFNYLKNIDLKQYSIMKTDNNFVIQYIQLWVTAIIYSFKTLITY